MNEPVLSRRFITQAVADDIIRRCAGVEIQDGVGVYDIFRNGWHHGIVVTPDDPRIGTVEWLFEENGASGCPESDERESAQPPAPHEIGVLAGSPLAVGSGQTGRTLTTSGWSAEPPHDDHDLHRFADDGGPA